MLKTIINKLRDTHAPHYSMTPQRYRIVGGIPTTNDASFDNKAQNAIQVQSPTGIQTRTRLSGKEKETTPKYFQFFDMLWESYSKTESFTIDIPFSRLKTNFKNYIKSSPGKMRPDMRCVTKFLTAKIAQIAELEK